jgi:hypothetical protein
LEALLLTGGGDFFDRFFTNSKDKVGLGKTQKKLAIAKKD